MRMNEIFQVSKEMLVGGCEKEKNLHCFREKLHFAATRLKVLSEPVCVTTENWRPIILNGGP